MVRPRGVWLAAVPTLWDEAGKRQRRKAGRWTGGMEGGGGCACHFRENWFDLTDQIGSCPASLFLSFCLSCLPVLLLGICGTEAQARGGGGW